MSNLYRDQADGTNTTPDVARPDAEPLSRRQFFKASGLGALGVAIIPAAGMGWLATPGEVYAQNFSTFDSSVGKTLMRMARDIFPHDKLSDKPYAAVIESYDKKAASDPGTKSLMVDGATNLNNSAVKAFGKPYAEVAGEGDRLVLLYAIEQTPFFQKIRGDLVFGLYNNKELFPVFGYEGSSFEKGGYLEHGFDDIDWV